MKKLLLLLICSNLAILINACSQQEEPVLIDSVKIPISMPVVNDENCKLENIKLIGDENIKKEFSGLCFHKPIYKKSPERSWSY